MSQIEFRGVSKTYGDLRAVHDLNLTVKEGEFFSLLGPSGCGKTTSLRMVAGFVHPSTGAIYLDEQDVTNVPIERRDVGIVFQNYAIFPHMNVFENISFGLRMRKLPADRVRELVTGALAQVGLAGYEERYQRELSGGEQQRVALARVLVTQPRILLLDEPLSALDRKLREEMKYWIKGLQSELGITTLYVTHDQNEALTLSDRVAVMHMGEVLQVDTPKSLYERPAQRRVADFIGHSNILEAQIVATDGEFAEVEFAGVRTMARRPAVTTAPLSGAVSIMVRPENVLLGEDVARSSACRLRGVIASRVYEGPVIRYLINLDASQLVAEQQNRPGQTPFDAGTEVDVGWAAEACNVLID